MRDNCRSLLLAAAFSVSVGAGAATAQTVIVRHAPPGSTVELVLNTGTPTTTAADASGNVRLDVNLAAAGKGDTDAYMFIDQCEQVRRISIVERSVQLPPALGNCSRTQVGGLFWLRQISTMVVDLAEPTPRMWLSQGPPPSEWLVDRPEGVEGPRRTVPVGLVLFGGAGLTSFSDAVVIACGNVASCTDKSGISLAAGAAVWINRFIGAEVSYLKPARLKMEAAETGCRFNSFLNPHVVNISGTVGAPVGPARIYGKGGMNYHRATFATTQTLDTSTVTVDGVVHTTAGGTQSFALRTAGWGWQFGAGLEVWATSRFAIYGEAAVMRLKGNDSDDVGEGRMDDRATALIIGGRIRIGG